MKKRESLKFAYGPYAKILQKGIYMAQLEQVRVGPMSLILNSTRRRNMWYRVLRYGKRFGLFDSVRHGLWLARGRA